jgi:hypothetical protein
MCKKGGKIMSRRLILAFLTGALLVAACGSTAAPAAPVSTLKLAPVSALSTDVLRLPQEIQEAYRFALANPDILDKIPCYCGCSRINHASNLSCYIQSQTADGQVVFDSHAAG